MLVFYWFKGVSEDRPGGPWWVQEFKGSWGVSEKEVVNNFIKDATPFLHAYAITDVSVEIDPSNVEPPPAYIIFLEK